MLTRKDHELGGPSRPISSKCLFVVVKPSNQLAEFIEILKPNHGDVSLVMAQRINAANPPRPRVPSNIKLSFAVMTDPALRTLTRQIQVGCLRKLNTEVVEAIELVETFAGLIRKSSHMTRWERQLKA